MTADYPLIRTSCAKKLVGNGKPNGAALGRLLGCNRHNVSQMGTWLLEKHARRLVDVLPAAKRLDRRREQGKRTAAARGAKRTTKKARTP